MRTSDQPQSLREEATLIQHAAEAGIKLRHAKKRGSKHAAVGMNQMPHQHKGTRSIGERSCVAVHASE